MVSGSSAGAVGATGAARGYSFLDQAKPARSLGMRTIKVVHPSIAARELVRLL
jgi:hypothetical protein